MLSHSVLVVGYANDPANNGSYWTVKNSYGVEWGDKGYIKIAKDKKNMCGIAACAAYPVV